MSNISGWLRATSFVSALIVSTATSATTGYFALGYGAKSMGLAGAVVSNPQDSISAAANPASVGLVGERIDFGLRLFSPTRESQINTSVVGAGTNFGSAFDVQDDSRRNFFFIPNFGITKKLNDKFTLGFAVYGNGGMNSTYDDNIYDQTAAVLGNPSGPGATPAGAGTPTINTGTLGIDLAQSLQSLTLAMKANEAHTFGASLVVGIQRFSARGLGNFHCFTTSAAVNNPAACAPGGAQGAAPGFIPSPSLTDNGSDWSYGAGVRVGWVGDVTPNVTLGASVASKVYMTEFDDYSELFAEQGDLDIPANFALSVTFKATPKTKVSFDYQRILYEGVNSISNPGPVFVPPPAPNAGPNPPCGSAACLLGTDAGMGFGWEDVDIYRLAVEYARNSQWIYRAGVAYNNQPIDQSQVLFNILAPAVVQKHATVGFTYKPTQGSEWNFAYMHALEEEVSTQLSAFGLPASTQMFQNSIDLSYSKQF